MRIKVRKVSPASLVGFYTYLCVCGNNYPESCGVTNTAPLPKTWYSLFLPCTSIYFKILNSTSYSNAEHAKLPVDASQDGI